MDCKFCGTPSGILDDFHLSCKRLAAEGKSPEEIREALGMALGESKAALSAKSIFWAAFWAVFAALWAYNITNGIVLFYSKLFFKE